MINKNILFIVMMFLFSISFISALDDLGTVKEGEIVRVKQTCASCTYVNFSITYPNSTLAIQNQEMSSLGAGVWYYDFSDTDIVGRYDVIGMGDLNGVDSSFTTFFEVTRTGDPTPTGVPTIQGILALLIFGVAWFMLFLSDKFREVGFKIFFMLLAFVFVAGALLTIFQILVTYNVSQGLSDTLTALVFVVLSSLFIVFLFILVRQTIVALDFLKIKKGLKMDSTPSMKGFGRNQTGF